MATTLPEEIKIAFGTELEQLRVGLAQANARIGQFASSASRDLNKVTRSHDDFAKVISTGKQATHLKLIAGELGNMAAAGGAATKATGAFLGGIHALDAGLMGVAGPVGLLLASVGLLTTGLAFLRDRERETTEEAKKLAQEHEQVSKAFDKAAASGLKLSAPLKAYADQIAKLTEEQRSGERVTLMHRIFGKEEELKKLDKVLGGLADGTARLVKGSAADLRARARALREELIELRAREDVLRKGASTVVDFLAKEGEVRSANDRKREESDRLDQERSRLGVEAIANRIKAEDDAAKAAEANASRTQAAWMSATSGIQGALAQMLEAGRFSMDMLEQYAKRAAAQGLVKGVFGMIGSILFPPAAAGAAASGAAGGLGGLFKSILGLAEGGIVTRPTLAVVGEAGPEAVVPLRRGGGGMMGGTTIGSVTINAPNVRDRRDLTSPAFVETAAVALSLAEQRRRERSGQGIR